MSSLRRVVKKHFRELKPLCVLDPLFLPLFILVCPEKELPELILQIPLYISAAFALQILRNKRMDNFTEPEVYSLTPNNY